MVKQKKRPKLIRISLEIHGRLQAVADEKEWPMATVLEKILTGQLKPFRGLVSR